MTEAATPGGAGLRPHLLVFNQYYRPAVEATGQLLTDLCEGLADEYDVTVVTGSAEEAEGPGPADPRVKVVRVASTEFERRRLSLRALNYVTYVALAVRAGLSARPPSVVLCMTDPPFLGDAALLVARRFGAPLVVISQDVFPEIAVELGRLTNPVLVGMLRVLVGWYLRGADRVVVIGETMRRRLEAKGVEADRLRVISNWVDTRTIAPPESRQDWAARHGLEGRFIVMHSGNVGHAQDLDSLVRATTFLRDLDRLAVVVIGHGARHAELVALAERLEADAVHFLPYQPREVLPASLAAADLHVVGLARGLAGFVVPSRLYGVLAAGRPVIVAADEDSETAQVVARAGCGVVVPPGRPELLAGAVRSAYEGVLDLAAMGCSARRYAVAEADREVALRRYRAVLHEVDGRGVAA